MRVFVALAAIFSVALFASRALADGPGDWVAKMSPGTSADAAKALEDATYPVDQLSAELDALAKTGEPGKIAETLTAVQKASGAKYWSDSFDLVAALVALPAADANAYRSLLGTVCILHALAKNGSEEAVSRMILVATEDGGMLRFDVARRLRALGDAAVAPLILARQDKRVRGFAVSTLEAMQKKIPGDAVQAKTDASLCAILAAYGRTKDMDALGAVMSFVSSERDEVRTAARAAVLAYGELARAKLAETYANVMSAPAPNEWEPERIARAIFDVYDKQRNAEVDSLVDEGLAKSASGDDVAAITAFDKALARKPFHPRRALMAPAYVERAKALESSDPVAARAAFEKSLELDPSGARAPEARAELAVMDGLALEARGIEDRATFVRALALDPTNVSARAALDRIDARARDGESRARTWTWAALMGAAFVVILVLFARLPRKKQG